MNPYEIIDRYYTDNESLRQLLITHSKLVAKKSLDVCMRHKELNADEAFVCEAALIHDIGIFLCDAPSIHCFGKEPYLRHGLLGGKLMRAVGYPRHARVCERHTGTGLTRKDIIDNHLPLPPKDFLPETVEEKIVCYADKFYSKTRLEHQKSTDEIIRGLRRFGEDSVSRFVEMHKMFG